MSRRKALTAALRGFNSYDRSGSITQAGQPGNLAFVLASPVVASVKISGVPSLSRLTRRIAQFVGNCRL
jgi:hypothetical protein